MQCDVTQVGIADVRTLILLLGSPEQNICVGAIEALTKHAEVASKHRVQLLNLGIIRPLLDLSSSKENALKKAAVACIAACTELSEIHPEMRKKELIEALILLLGPEEPVEVQDEAAFSLASLAKDFSNKSEIRRAGGIKSMVKLLESPDPDVKKNVGLALSIILEDCESFFATGAEHAEVANRSEIRYVNGLAPLLELLGSEFAEVQENALVYTNRVEIRKLNGVKRLIDLLSQDLPDLHHLTLLCIANCLEDPETCSGFPEMGGLPPVVKLISAEDVRAKKNASLVCRRADRNQNFIREAGALQVLSANLSHTDPGAVSYAAIALASLAKNEINQLELNKMGVVEIVLKLLSNEDLDLSRQSTLALSSLCLNGKTRSKVKALDAITSVIRLLHSDDAQTQINTAECLSNLTEDTANRSDIVKQGGVPALIALLYKPEAKVQSAGALALSRLMQDDKKAEAIGRLVALLSSKDISVSRNAAYALANAAQLEATALLACQQGAIEALLNLSRESLKNSSKFANDALDKLLNHHLAAKYWLRNELTFDNLIRDGFYDYGSAGTNLSSTKGFANLSDLKVMPVDTRREVLLIDSEADPQFVALCTAASANLSARSRIQQVRQVAAVVCAFMGGVVDPLIVGEFGHKLKITELKVRLQTNVLPLGLITMGTFYHRALLFKAICDRIGLGPCSLVRGDYNRAWNIIDIRKLA
ncbi:Armadillo repeat-containing protein 3, partial [Irineochytrium annulatum]